MKIIRFNSGVTQPEDRGILLRDIIECGEVDRTKSYALDANYYKGGSEEYLKRTYEKNFKRRAVKYQSARRLMVKTVAHGFVKEKEEEREKYPSLCAQSPHTKHMIRVGTAQDIAGHDYNKRVYSPDGKSPSLAGRSGGNLHPKVATDDMHYRMLTPLECERLQTVPEGYTDKGVSKTQRYKMLGNGWTVKAISHIFRCAYADN